MAIETVITGTGQPRSVRKSPHCQQKLWLGAMTWGKVGELVLACEFPLPERRKKSKKWLVVTLKEVIMLYLGHPHTFIRISYSLAYSQATNKQTKTKTTSGILNLIFHLYQASRLPTHWESLKCWHTEGRKGPIESTSAHSKVCSITI